MLTGIESKNQNPEQKKLAEISERLSKCLEDVRENIRKERERRGLAHYYVTLLRSGLIMSEPGLTTSNFMESISDPFNCKRRSKL